MKKIVLLTVIAGLAMSRIAMGDAFLNGRRIASWCDDGASLDERNRCAAYLAGVADVHAVLLESGYRVPAICMPDSTTSEALRLALLRRVKDRPELLHRSAGSISINAFAKAWPCPEQTPDPPAGPKTDPPARESKADIRERGSGAS